MPAPPTRDCTSCHPWGCWLSPREDRYLVAGVTRGATIFLVVALAGQEPVAGPAGEAVSVVLLLHCLHRHVPRPQRFVAKGTDICGKKREWGLALCASVSPIGDEPTSGSPLTSRTIPLRVPIHILPLRPARLLLAKCGRPQFGGEGRRGLGLNKSTFTFMLLQMGKLRHRGDRTP